MALALFRNTPAVVRRIYPFTQLLSAAQGRMVYEEIRQWQGYAPTPLRELDAMARRAGVRRVLYKDEAARFGLGSFKALGGAYAVSRLLRNLLSARSGRAISLAELADPTHRAWIGGVTIACASDGNHGRAVAAAAQRFGCGCAIFLHQGVSARRAQAIAEMGAQVIRTTGDYDHSVHAALQTSQAQGWHVVADTAEDPADPMPLLVMQGYTTPAIETLQQLHSSGNTVPTHVFLQAGVGGLAAAVVSYLWEELGPHRAPIFIVVEPDRADALYQSALSGRPTQARGDLNTLMAGLSCGQVSRVAWPILEAGVEFFMTVEDEAAIDCMRMLRRGALGGGSIIGGESGVAGLAGLLAATQDPMGQALAQLRLDSSSTVLLFGTEGATDPDIYESLTGQ